MTEYYSTYISKVEQAHTILINTTKKKLFLNLVPFVKVGLLVSNECRMCHSRFFEITQRLKNTHTYVMFPELHHPNLTVC